MQREDLVMTLIIVTLAFLPSVVLWELLRARSVDRRAVPFATHGRLDARAEK